jgi:hypothetical protein
LGARMTIVGIGGKGFIIKYHIITDDFQLPPLTLVFVTERGSPLSSRDCRWFRQQPLTAGSATSRLNEDAGQRPAAFLLFTVSGCIPPGHPSQLLHSRRARSLCREKDECSCSASISARISKPNFKCPTCIGDGQLNVCIEFRCATTTCAVK